MSRSGSRETVLEGKAAVNLMRMGSACSAHPAGSRRAGARRRLARAAPGGGGEHGELLLEPGRATMRALCPFPVFGTNQELAVALAFLTMKFINRHELSITGWIEISSANP